MASTNVFDLLEGKRKKKNPLTHNPYSAVASNLVDPVTPKEPEAETPLTPTSGQATSKQVSPTTQPSTPAQQLTEKGIIPYETTRADPREEDPQMDGANQRYTREGKRAERLARTAALGQGVTAIAEILTLGRNPDAHVGVRNSADLGVEAYERLINEDERHLAALDDHYQRILQFEQEEQAVEQENTAMTNELVLEEINKDNELDFMEAKIRKELELANDPELSAERKKAEMAQMDLEIAKTQRMIESGVNSGFDDDLMLRMASQGIVTDEMFKRIGATEEEIADYRAQVAEDQAEEVDPNEDRLTRSRIHQYRAHTETLTRLRQEDTSGDGETMHFNPQDGTPMSTEAMEATNEIERLQPLVQDHLDLQYDEQNIVLPQRAKRYEAYLDQAAPLLHEGLNDANMGQFQQVAASFVEDIMEEESVDRQQAEQKAQEYLIEPHLEEHLQGVARGDTNSYEQLRKTIQVMGLQGTDEEVDQLLQDRGVTPGSTAFSSLFNYSPSYGEPPQNELQPTRTATPRAELNTHPSDTGRPDSRGELEKAYPDIARNLRSRMMPAEVKRAYSLLNRNIDNPSFQQANEEHFDTLDTYLDEEASEQQTEQQEERKLEARRAVVNAEWAIWWAKRKRNREIRQLKRQGRTQQQAEADTAHLFTEIEEQERQLTAMKNEHEDLISESR